MSDDIERTASCVFDLPFRCTNAEHRDFMMDLQRTPLWREWSKVDHVVRNGRFNALSPDGEALCARLSDLTCKVRVIVYEMIRDFEAKQVAE